MQKQKKSKSKDDRPARKRYWMKRQLEKHKVGNLVRCCKMTVEQAMKLWNNARKNRIPSGFND